MKMFKFNLISFISNLIQFLFTFWIAYKNCFTGSFQRDCFVIGSAVVPSYFVIVNSSLGSCPCFLACHLASTGWTWGWATTFGPCQLPYCSCPFDLPLGSFPCLLIPSCYFVPFLGFASCSFGPLGSSVATITVITSSSFSTFASVAAAVIAVVAWGSSAGSSSCWACWVGSCSYLAAIG